MNNEFVGGLVFYALAAVALAGAGWVAFSRNIVHSAFALLGTFIGVAGLYAFLSADLLAVIQLLVYVGGILIVILFAVMLTARIDEARVSNPTVGRFPGMIILAGVSVLLTVIGVQVFGGRVQLSPERPTTAPIGDALLGPFVLPFEVISILLLAALLGSVTLASGKMSARRSPNSGPQRDREA